jgi:predicted Zn-dependent protease
LILFTALSLKAQDFSYDQKIGADAARQVEQMVGIYPDSALNAYITTVGMRLAAGLGETPFEFRFHVADMAEPNAFALPGGYVYVSRGILTLINMEDELAGVMGHEMVHVTKRHSVKQMKKGIIPGILKIPGALIGGLVDEDLGRIINTPVDFGSALFMSSYSRKQETEADELGIKLASRAGYDPAKLSNVLENLEQEMQMESGEAEKKSYFSSHPYTPKRVENIESKAPLLEWEPKPPIVNPIGLSGKLDGMIIGSNPAQGVFRENVFMHPDLNISVSFPEKWELLNVPVAVAATQPDGKAQVYLGSGESEKHPDSLGLAFAKVLEERYKIQPSQNKSMNVNGFPGHLVSFKDLSGETPVDVQLYWIKTEQVMLNIMGIGYMDYSAMLENTALSVRPLTDEEKNTITALRIRLVEAEEGETLQSLTQRSGNEWDVETTALINNIPNDAMLEQGSLVKIAKREAYP